jgi:hypothetical protein
LKIQDLFAHYLYEHKSLTLPGVGTFEVNPDVNIYETKEAGWPENTITFKADKTAIASDEFITYLAKNSGKMKTLAVSDLESFINNGQQFLNIGKPFQIMGVGSLIKPSLGDLMFQQGMPVLEKSELPNAEYILKERTKQDELTERIDFSHEAIKSSKMPIIIFGSVIAVALIALAIYFALPKKEKTTDLNNEQTQVQDTVQTIVNKPDTSTTAAPQSMKPDTLQVQTTTNLPADSFQLLIQSFKYKNIAEAKEANLKLRGHRVSLQMKDSTRYDLILTVLKPLSDTAHVKDSLKRFYLWRTKLIQPGN